MLQAVVLGDGGKDSCQKCLRGRGGSSGDIGEADSLLAVENSEGENWSRSTSRRTSETGLDLVIALVCI